MKKEKKSVLNFNFIFLIIILLGSLILKLLILHYPESNHVYLDEPEECWVGTIANLILNKSNINLVLHTSFVSKTVFYQGRLVEGLITSIMFKLFGISGFSTKYTYIFFSLIATTIIYVFSLKLFSKRIAQIMGILLLFPIPVLTVSSLTQGGPHLSGALIEILIFFIFLFALKKNKENYMILIGFISVIGFIINYTSIIMTFVLFLFMIIIKKKKFLKIFLLSILLFSPILILYVNYSNHFNVEYVKTNTNLINIKKTINNIPTYILKIKKFFLNDFFKLFFWRTPNILNLFYFVLVLISPLIFLFSKNTKYKNESIIILLYFVIHLFSYLTVAKLFTTDNSDIIYNSRHFISTFYLVLIPISFLLNKIYKEKKLFFYIILNVLIITGFLANINLINMSKKNSYYYNPYCYDSVGVIPDNFQKIDDIHKFDFLMHFAESIHAVPNLYHNINLSDSNCLYYNPYYPKFCYAIYNSSLKDFELTIKIKDETTTHNYILITSHANRYYIKDIMEDNFLYNSKKGDSALECTYRYSKRLSYLLGPDFLKTEKIMCNKLDPYLRIYCYKGLGERIGELYFFNIEQGINQCKKLNNLYFETCKNSICDTHEIFDENKTLLNEFCSNN